MALEEEVEESGESGGGEWIMTYADLVTLLFAFFVLLYSMSSVQQESFKELVQSLKSALGVQQVPEAGTREGLTMVQNQEQEPDEAPQENQAVDEAGNMVQKELDEITSEVRELIMFNRLGGKVKVNQDGGGATITISDLVLFPAGNASMTNQGVAIMNKITDILSQFPYHIKVAGHTDNIPIKTAKYASNWELSSSRACEVVRFLISEGIDPKMLSAEGFAEFKPIASNETAAGRAKNRRVEIIYERNAVARQVKEVSNY